VRLVATSEHRDGRSEASVRLLVAFALLASACGSKTSTKAPSCADATGRAVDGMVKRAKDLATTPGLAPDAAKQIDERTKQLDALAPRWRALLANHCTDDKWPPAVIECHGRVTSMDELRACRATLSAEQQAKVQNDELALMNGDTGLPGLAAAPAPVATSPEITRLEGELRALNVQLGEAVRKLAAVTTEPDRAAAKDDVRRLQTEMQRVNGELEGARKVVDRDPIAIGGEKMQRAYEAVTAQVDATMLELANAKTDADRQAIAPRLQSLLAQQANLAKWANRAPAEPAQNAQPAQP
jgi:hypothetical protein